MQRLELGLLCGVVFGALSAASMLPMQFPDKRAALLAAFLNRFAIGVLAAIAFLPGWHGWLTGLTVGLLVSLSDAVITKAYAPVLLIGMAGGGLIGWILERFAR